MDVMDTALSPLGGGTAQPPTEAIVATLEGTEYDTGMDLKLLVELASYFRGVAADLTKAGLPRSRARTGHRRQYPALSGAGRDAVQPDQPTEAGQRHG